MLRGRSRTFICLAEYLALFRACALAYAEACRLWLIQLWGAAGPGGWPGKSRRLTPGFGRGVAVSGMLSTALRFGGTVFEVTAAAI